MFTFRLFKLIVGVLFNTALFGGLLFLPAGTFDWWRAWVFIGVMVTLVVVSVTTLPRELIDERSKPPIQKGQPLADKVVVVVFAATFLGLFAFIPVDVFGRRIMGEPGAAISSFGLGLAGVGCCIMYLTLRENAFAAPVVRHQEERRQAVVETGFYRVVRHPMYAGAALLLLGAPLWLESYAATVLASIPIATLAVRIVFEEEFLRGALNGYDQYRERVRYRLIPFVW